MSVTQIQPTPVTSQEFAERLQRLRTVNGVVHQILKKTPFKEMPKHLRNDAIKRMGLGIFICEITGMESYYHIGGEQTELTTPQWLGDASPKWAGEKLST